MSNLARIQAVATSIDLAPRWSDQDVNGHINHAILLTLLEEARIQVTQRWTNTRPGLASDTRRVVRSLTASFEREVHYAVNTTGLIWVTRMGRTSFDFGQLLLQDGQPCVYSLAAMVVLDGQTGRPTPIDATLRAQLEPHVAPAYDPAG